MSFEFNFSIAQTVTMLSPLIATAPEPIPTTAIWIFCVLAFIITNSLRHSNTKSRKVVTQNLEQQILSILSFEESYQVGNMSSLIIDNHLI